MRGGDHRLLRGRLPAPLRSSGRGSRRRRRGSGDAAAAAAVAEAAAGAREMAPFFFELAAAWPIGYRLEEKCDVVGVICVAPFQDVRRGRFIPPESSSKASLIQHSQHFGQKAAFNPRRRAVLSS